MNIGSTHNKALKPIRSFGYACLLAAASHLAAEVPGKPTIGWENEIRYCRSQPGSHRLQPTGHSQRSQVSVNWNLWNGHLGDYAKVGLA